ncbi:RNA polymerase sigma factor [Streptomyces sp. YGL11-2]|uniref:RNA polymerase sigma factor n=1 Tax=Streptomyces sp. YGL11-2 TaxID=3414028 RepID=UPI003CF9D6C0
MPSWEEALELLAQGRGTALKRYGYLLCGSEADASDLVQEALIRVFARPRRDWALPALEAYVRKAMLHYHLDQTARRRRWLEIMPRIADRRDSPAADASTERADVVQLLQELSPRQRACVVLFYYEDRPLQEIATLLDCGVGTVKRHLDDARKRLAAAWHVTSEG